MYFYLDKLKKNLFYFIFFSSILLVSSNCFSSSFSGQGKYLSDNIIKKVENGMGKSRLLELLGDPTFVFTRNLDCLCYYYIHVPFNNNSKIIRRCVLLFFENDILISNKILH